MSPKSRPKTGRHCQRRQPLKEKMASKKRTETFLGTVALPGFQKGVFFWGGENSYTLPTTPLEDVVSWNLPNHPMKRKENDLNQSSMIMVHVSLPGCRMYKNPGFWIERNDTTFLLLISEPSTRYPFDSRSASITSCGKLYGSWTHGLFKGS